MVTDYITETGEPFTVEELLQVLKELPDEMKVRISAMVKRVDLLYGKAEGDVNRIVSVPNRDEIVLYSDFGNLE